MYNLTNVTAANDIVNIIGETNKLSGGLLFALVMLAIFLIIYITFKNFETKAVLLVDSFILILIALPAWTFGWIGWPIFIIPIILLFASILMWVFIN